MTAVIQRVLNAAVSVDGEVKGRCNKGFFIVLGVFGEDTREDACLLAEKIAKLRVFEDENGKMNRAINDVNGSVLVVSQFTLCASYSHGNRPDFLAAAKPSTAEPLYEYFSSHLRTLVEGGVENGVFGADMKIETLCDGPVTIVMESEKLKKKKG